MNDLKNITERKLTGILAKHKMWLKNSPLGIRANLRFAGLSGADLRGANLSGADLSGANINCITLPLVGNMVHIKTLQIYQWSIAYTDTMLRIGCQTHPIARWKSYVTEDGKQWISKMDAKATAFAEKLLPIILQIIDVSPSISTRTEQVNDK